MTDDIALRRAPMEITGAQNPSLRNRLRSYVRRSPRLRAVWDAVKYARALAEMHRVLRPHGRALLMVPIVEGWGTTYENAEAARTVAGRIQHFGQHDHIRVYGRDLRDRIRAAGFELATYTGSGADTVRYSLLGGETVFVATKPA